MYLLVTLCDGYMVLASYPHAVLTYYLIFDIVGTLSSLNLTEYAEECVKQLL